MSFKDLLLALTTYPEPTPVVAVERAVALASALGAKISAIACEAKISPPRGVLDRFLMDVPALVRAELEKSQKNARDLLAAFQGSAERYGVFHERILESCLTSEVPKLLTDYARLRDLTIVPVPDGDYIDQWYAESVIFGSGRPTIIIPQRKETPAFEAAHTVVVGWDFSRPASRAVADALPILQNAKRVFVVTVTNEKAFSTRRSGSELANNLARHGIEVTLDEIDAAGSKVGAVLESYVTSRRADLLVMGAYGHSRMHEFILGGVTKTMLSRPPLPILFSH